MLSGYKKRSPVNEYFVPRTELVKPNITDIIDLVIPKGKIIILWATIRPNVFKETHKIWMDNAYIKGNIITRVAVDTPEQASELNGYEVIVTNNTKPGVCFPCYCLSSTFITDPHDIIVFASDDFYPPKDWDLFIYKQLHNETNKVLVVNDGIQKYPNNVVTLPILTFGALGLLNYTIYHPAYTHMHSDVELYDISVKLGILKDVRNTTDTKFEHKHYCNGKRKPDSHDINLNNTMDEGKSLYVSRSHQCICELLDVSNEIKNLTSNIEKRDYRCRGKDLSILICTMPSRKYFLDRLLKTLNKQLNNRVEVLVESDDGEMKIGHKRNKLLDKSIGKYVCFVDDDDLVSDDYVLRILSGISGNPDCCSLEGIYTVNGENPTLFRHSIRYTKWETAIEQGEVVYYRCPNHLNPIRREIATKVRFNDSMSNGEDKDFSDRIREFLKNESVINDVIYHYLYLQVQKGY